MMLNNIERPPHKQNWALCVKELLSRWDFMDAWTFQEVGNVKMFIDIFTIRIRDGFMQEWHSRLQNSTRSRFFITFGNFNYQRCYIEVS